MGVMRAAAARGGNDCVPRTGDAKDDTDRDDPRLDDEDVEERWCGS